MGQIQDASPRPWRMELLPARFRGARFHVETEHYASGRRIAMHIYPKRDDPYAEDMGRTQRSYDITGYVIEFDRRLGMDYRKARDELIEALEKVGPGTLVLPTQRVLGPVCCMGYSRTESRDKGGVCTFEMKFVEFGRPGNLIIASNSQTQAQIAAAALNAQAAQTFNNSAAQNFSNVFPLPPPLPPLT